ncbi:MAG: hypothetical protein WA890_14465 [Micromonospora sp.]
MLVAIPAPLVTGGGQVLQLCTRHGEPAAQHKRVLFKSKVPSWTYLLIPLGLVAFAIVATVLEKRVKAPGWPFCPRCVKLRRNRLLGGIGMVVFAILAVVVLAAVVPQGTSYVGPIVLAFVALLLVGLFLTANAGWPFIASAHVSGDGHTVLVRKADPRFAEHVATLQQWVAQQQWAAQQGYHQPQQWQPQYAHPQYPQQQPYGPGSTMPS